MTEIKAGLNSLTPRQKEILRLIARGFQAKEIARELGIAEGTVRTHMEEARARLVVASTREAARLLSAAECLRNNDRRQTLQIAPAATDTPSSSGIPTDEATHAEQAVNHNTLHRSANGSGTADSAPARDGDRNPGHAGEARSLDGQRQSGPADASVRRSFSQRYIALIGGLNALSVIQWFALIVLGAVVAVLLFGGLMIGLFGMLQAVQQIRR